MKLIQRERVKQEFFPGQIIQKAVGKDGLSPSGNMTMGFARYGSEGGRAEPHNHAEEIVYVLSADGAWVRFGPAKDQLGKRVPISGGTVLHFPAQEWHIFECMEGGHVDLIFFSGPADRTKAI